jgi:hypothetical protein
VTTDEISVTNDGVSDAGCLISVLPGVLGGETPCGSTIEGTEHSPKFFFNNFGVDRGLEKERGK